MRKLLSMLLCLTLLLPTVLTAPVMAEAATLFIEAPAGVIRPGKAVLLSFSVPAAGECDLFLRAADGSMVQPVVENQPVTTGKNHLWWNGTFEGVPAPEGMYALVLSQNGAEVEASVTIGAIAPYITGIAADKDPETSLLTVDFYASVNGLLTVGLWTESAWTIVQSRQIEAGANRVVWDAQELTQYTASLTLTLTDMTGFSSNEEHIPVRREEFGLMTPTPTPTATPTP
ncbi:MAG: hypothetical protein E7327_10850, partial [Clostridiales bacterium]|nr:hypothetical protein [Clostridiales bacterium]